MSVAEESRGVTIIPSGYDHLTALMADFVHRHLRVIATHGAIRCSTGVALLVRDHQSSSDRNPRH